MAWHNRNAVIALFALSMIAPVGARSDQATEPTGFAQLDGPNVKDLHVHSGSKARSSLTLPPVDWQGAGQAEGVVMRPSDELVEVANESVEKAPARPAELDSYFNTPEYLNGQNTSTSGYLGVGRQLGGAGAALADGASLYGISALVDGKQD